MGEKVYSRSINTNPLIMKPQDEFFNSLGEMFGVRTPEVLLTTTGKFYLNIEVAPMTEMVIHERFISGRGLGRLKITTKINTNAIIDELDFFNPRIIVGGGALIPTSKYEYTVLDIAGDAVTSEPTFAYLGDEVATSPARSADAINIPTIAFERIIRNDTENAFRFGFEFELVNVVNSVYQGYLELYFTEGEVLNE